MACMIVLVAMLAPRVTMFFIFLLTNWFGQAYESVLWPLLEVLKYKSCFP
jgi:hypothetical protein